MPAVRGVGGLGGAAPAELQGDDALDLGPLLVGELLGTREDGARAVARVRHGVAGQPHQRGMVGRVAAGDGSEDVRRRVPDAVLLELAQVGVGDAAAPLDAARATDRAMSVHMRDVGAGGLRDRAPHSEPAGSR
ncbi:MAG: hypothetical protein M3N33_09225 [Actinomycetota bacterium]|nr:hypothetical protein [Actinomycetota bacterium]